MDETGADMNYQNHIEIIPPLPLVIIISFFKKKYHVIIKIPINKTISKR